MATHPISHAILDYPWERDPFATFTFKYRLRRDVQIEGLIPRGSSPVPLEERSPETLTAGEAHELVRIQRQKLQDQAKMKKQKRKRENDEDEDKEAGEVTMTGARNRRPRLSNDSGFEVIDLSNEDSEDHDRACGDWPG